MPKIKIERVISFSSEDTVHIANNILLGNPSLKWKCKSPGEKSATLVLQLEKASVINGIDIGNEYSAYIEVLVSRTGLDNDYKVLLVMSSFMKPNEARNSTNGNQVRMFKSEDLSKPECEQKWDRIKIVCTQPFNKFVQYGLSFIAFHTNVGAVGNTNATGVFGRFSLRPPSPDPITAGTLFASRKELSLKEPAKAAAAIRDANSAGIAKKDSPLMQKIKNLQSSGTSAKHRDSTSNTSSPRPRNRNDLFYGADEEKPNEKIDKLIENKKKESEEKQKIETNKNKTIIDNGPSTSKQESLDASVRKTPKRKINVIRNKRRLSDDEVLTNKKNKVEYQKKPFPRLLENVVIVISGIPNPDRATLRTKALEMGAKYRGDWNATCTHLICAFQNTPKFKQVKGHGKIVTRKWIEECHSQRKHLPWRRFALDKKDKDRDESDTEIHEEIQTNDSSDSDHEVPNVDDDILEPPSEIDDKVQKILDKQNKKNTISKNNAQIRINNDSKREMVDRIDHKNNGIVNKNITNSKVFDIYQAETDSEPEVVVTTIKKTPKKKLSFFKNLTFFIDHIFDEDMWRLIKRYIVYYKGIVADDPTDTIDYFVTNVDNRDVMKELNDNAFCVSSNWIWECHHSERLVSTAEYIL